MDLSSRVKELETENDSLKEKLRAILGYANRAEEYKSEDDWNKGYRRAMFIVKAYAL